MSTAHLTQAADKASVTLDMERQHGREAMLQLLGAADIFVENHRPATAHAMGLDDTSTLKLSPRLVHCSMTGYGRGGDLENAPAYDVNIEASAGIMMLTGTEETGPLRTGAPIMNHSVALAATFAISAALYEREKTRRGTFIDVSMLETAYTLMSSTIADYTATRRPPKPRGNAANSRSPGPGSFPCRDGMLSLGVNEECQFHALAKGLGREAWLRDPRFAERCARAAHADALEEEIIRALSVKTADEWEGDLLVNGVPVAKMRSLPECPHHTHTKARGFVHQDKGTGLGVPTLPFRLGQTAQHRPGRPRQRSARIPTRSCGI